MSMFISKDTSDREAWEWLLWLEKHAAETIVDSKDVVLELLANEKRALRRRLKTRVDRLATPITEEWRGVNHHDYDGYTEGRIFPGDWSDMTDEEIDDLVREREIRISYPWDCTGLPFTVCLEWKRIPIGISVVHSVGLDV